MFLADIYFFEIDEATSALDPTSRVLVFEALKEWRKNNKTTIVITHDLSQIEKGNFVYVLREGRVVEQGFRCDLEGWVGGGGGGGGEFREMVEAQRRMGGYLPKRASVDFDENFHVRVLPDEPSLSPAFNQTHHESMMSMSTSMALQVPSLRPLTLGNWTMSDVVGDFTASGRPNHKSTLVVPDSAWVVKDSDPRRVSRYVPVRRVSSAQVLASVPARGPTFPREARTVDNRPLSLQLPRFSVRGWGWGRGRGRGVPMGRVVAEEDEEEWDEEEKMFEEEKCVVEMNGSRAIGKRGKRVRKRWDCEKGSVRVDSKHKAPSPEHEHQHQHEDRPSFWKILRETYPTIPYKPLLFLGLVTCIANGAMTPIFSFLLSRLLFEVSTGAHNIPTINAFGGLLLGIAALDGLLMGSKYFLLETSSNAWITHIRRHAFRNVLAQDKKWHDRGGENAGVRVVQTMVKDGDDARNLVAVVLGEGCVVAAMVGVGLVWAMARGWQLTMVGVVVIPVFAGTMALQAALVTRCELKNKRAREEVARGYYDVRFGVFFFFAWRFLGLKMGFFFGRRL